MEMKDSVNLLITLDVINLVILGIALFIGQFQVPVIIPILWIIVALIAHLDIKEYKKKL
jgi:hypothetical protein